MSANKLLAAAAVSIVFILMSATAGARALRFDSWATLAYQVPGSSVSLDALPYGPMPDGVTSLVFDPGTSAGDYRVLTNELLNNQMISPTTYGNMFAWCVTTSCSGVADDQQFVLTRPISSGNSFQISFNDDAASCSKAASLTVNSTTYVSSSPCTAGVAFGDLNPCTEPTTCSGGVGFHESDFSFSVTQGKVVLSSLPKGWSVVAAPELDPQNIGAIGALLGARLVLVRRRR